MILLCQSNINSSVWKVVFGHVRNVKCLEFPQKNLTIAWDRLINKYDLQSASSLFKQKSELNKKVGDDWERSIWVGLKFGRIANLNEGV